MHLLSTRHISSTWQLESLFYKAEKLRDGKEQKQSARGRVLAVVKDEGSTRTRVSFEVAMKRLGGDVVLLELDKNSSAVKGETLEDTIKTISQYADAIVLRHSRKGAVQRAAEVSAVPVINAGDGDGEHPTQAILDAYTIWRRFRRMDDLSVMLVGDLKSSRTVHSLLHLLALYKNKDIHLVSPKELYLPDEYHNLLRRNCVNITHDYELDVALEKYGKGLDVLYMTRFQKERYEGVHEMSRMAGIEPTYYKLDAKCVGLLRGDTAVMHPLPRNGEIPVEFDKDSRAVYFDQVKNGMYIRMVLLDNLFSGNSFFAV